MAGEQFLLSGDQLASYTGWTESYPPPNYNVNLSFTGVSVLGTASDRYFLVRSQGGAGTVSNGDLFQVFPAVDDGSGGLEPGPTPLLSGSLATPDAYDSTVVGDDYAVLGLYGGDRVIVNLAGFNGTNSFTAVEGSTTPGGDGELQLAEITAADPDAVACFAAGTLITTLQGETPVEQLRVGDKVLTLDRGFQEIRWISHSVVELGSGNFSAIPILLKAGCFGDGVPSVDVQVSPCHRILVASKVAQLYFGEADVLVAAKHLVNGRSIIRDISASTVSYWHFLLDDHGIVFTSGLRSETLHPGACGLSTLGMVARTEFPELENKHSPIGPALSRMELKACEARILSNSLAQVGVRNPGLDHALRGQRKL